MYSKIYVEHFGPGILFTVYWHRITVDALRLQLIEFDPYLEYEREVMLSADKKHGQRIDLLVIKKLSEIKIPISIARSFKKMNVFEIKGKNDSLDSISYYRAIGYVSQLLYLSSIQTPESTKDRRSKYTRKDITLSFISHSYPRELVKHLQGLQNADGRTKIAIEKVTEGIYDIHGETYDTQFIVLSQISKEEYKYLRCIFDSIRDRALCDSAISDCTSHFGNPLYDDYASGICRIVNKQKEDIDMSVPEGVFELFGTSSAEVAEKAVVKERAEIDRLNGEIAALRDLLEKNNIPVPAFK